MSAMLLKRPQERVLRKPRRYFWEENGFLTIAEQERQRLRRRNSNREGPTAPFFLRV